MSDCKRSPTPLVPRAQHDSNGLVERKIGQLNESTRAALLACDLLAYLWPEVYMAMCHTQNIVPNSALQGELKNKEQQRKKKRSRLGRGTRLRGRQGREAAAKPVEIPVRDMVPWCSTVTLQPSSSSNWSAS